MSDAAGSPLRDAEQDDNQEGAQGGRLRHRARYTELTSWLLFLKDLDGLADDRASLAALEGRSPSPILEDAYRWNSWAAPKEASGPLDHHAALTGDDLRDFVNQRLFPYLERFMRRRSSGWATPTRHGP